MFVGQSAKSDKDSFLAEKARNREDRETSRHRTENAVKIQSTVRGFLSRCRLRKNKIAELSEFLEKNPNWNDIDAVFLDCQNLCTRQRLAPLFSKYIYSLFRLTGNPSSRKQGPKIG